jgi:hypothetical protein
VNGHIPPHVPSPSDEWIAQRRAQLVQEFARQRRRRLTHVAARFASGLIASGTIILVAVLGSGAAPAFGGWSPTPTASTGAQVRAAESACRLPGVLALAAPVIADARGPYTMLLLLEGGTSHLCISTPSLTTLTSGGPIEPAPSTPDGIAITATGTSTADGHPYSFLIGRAGSAVIAITLTLESDTQVRVTVRRGWFAAWWPGTPRALRAQVTSSSGTVVAPIAAPRPPARPSPPASRSGQTGESGDR